MKKVLILSLSIFLIPLATNATVTAVSDIASTSYVAGAYDVLDTSKQASLSSSNVTTSGSTGCLAAAAASNGAVGFTKSEISVPVGSNSSSSRAGIWIE